MHASVASIRTSKPRLYCRIPMFLGILGDRIEVKKNMAYFGHSNACWNIHGKSYAELASTAPSSSSQATSDISPNYKAGTPSGLRPRGAGSFLAQVGVAGHRALEY